jgi:PHP family Zn ribbon phosphoesterase
VIEKINRELEAAGCNLSSDGRPIIGLSSIELCELVFGVDEKCLIIPAHVWTPWFSLYGSKSGFDSIDECFGKYAKYIYAIETGLSSDPAMNWRIGELEGRTILSSSDAHSGPKLGREVTVFEIPGRAERTQMEQIDMDQTDSVVMPFMASEIYGAINRTTTDIKYDDIYEAIKNVSYKDKTKPRIAGTIEFYPEEGKYHYTGHRNCKVSYSPGETERRGATCPVCGKGLTVGVMHRVQQLAGHKFQIPNSKFQIDSNGVQWIFHPENKKPPYTMLVPLMEILGEVLESGVNTKAVQNEYNKLTTQIGSEFNILLRASLEDLERISGGRFAQAVKKVRGGDIVVNPGFDGEFGRVSIFRGEESKGEDKQEQLGIF